MTPPREIYRSQWIGSAPTDAGSCTVFLRGKSPGYWVSLWESDQNHTFSGYASSGTFGTPEEAIRIGIDMLTSRATGPITLNTEA